MARETESMLSLNTSRRDLGIPVLEITSANKAENLARGAVHTGSGLVAAVLR